MSSNVLYQAAQLKVDKVILELGFVQPTKFRCIAFIAGGLFLVMMRIILGYLTILYFFIDEVAAEHDN